MPDSEKLRGESTSGERAFEGNWTALGVIGSDLSVEIIWLGSSERTTGALDGPDTIRFVHGNTKDRQL